MTRATRREMLGTALASFAAAAVSIPAAVAETTRFPVVSAAGSYTDQIAEIERQWATHDGHPDAELIALCDQVIAIEAEWGKLVNISSELHPKDPAYADLHRREDDLMRTKDPLIDQIFELPTHTLAGFRARAKAIMCSDYGAMASEWAFGGMLIALLDELAGEPDDV